MRSRLLMSVAVAISLGGTAASAKTYRAERYDVQLDIDKPGNLDVTETVVYRFGDGSFTYVYRDIAATETDGITNVRAWMDGQFCTPGTGPGQVEIHGESPVKVRWHFAPVSNQTHTFVVKYRALGVVRKEAAGDTIIWRALPPQRRYRTEASEVTLRYPAGVQLRNAGIRGKRAAILFGDHSATASMSNLDGEARATFRAEFAPGAFDSGVPRWLAQQQSRRREFGQGAITGGLAALPLVGLAILMLFRLRGSEWTPAAMAPASVTQPPGDLPPALAAAMTGSGHGSAGLLLDLARRGIVRIEETEKRRFSSGDFRVIRGPVGRLAPHEEKYLSLLFPHGETEMPLSKSRSRLTSKWRHVRSVIDRELTLMGFVDEEKRRRRRLLLAGGAVLLPVGLAMAGLAFGRVLPDWESGALLAAGAGVALCSIFAIILGGIMPQWTSSGAVASSQWRQFRNYVKELSKTRGVMPSPNVMDRLLPYAAAFGVAQTLLKSQKSAGAIELPPWFAALGRGDGSEFAAFVALMGSADSSSAASAASAAGASGGGASGAG